MKTILTILTTVALLAVYPLNAQVAINTDGSSPHSSAMLDIQSNNRGTSFPNLDIDDMSTAAPVTSPKTGLIAYNTNSSTGPGLVMWTGSEWVTFELEGINWKLLGNAGTSSSTNFVGTTDAVSLPFRTNNTERMRIRSDGIVSVNSTGAFGVSTFYSWASGDDDAIDIANDGDGNAVYGQQKGNGNGVYGYAGGTGNGVRGYAAGSGDGVHGYANGTGDGVYGGANDDHAFGIFGGNWANTNSGESVVGITGGAGNNSGTLSVVSLIDHETGVTGTGNGQGGVGVVGFTFNSSTSSTEMAGFFEADFDGDTDTHDGPTVYLAGYDNTNSNQYGVYAYVPDQDNNSVAIKGVYTGGGAYNATGVIGDASQATNRRGYGVRGYGDHYGVYGEQTDNTNAACYGVYANGNLGASGTKPFMIDYPLDPENKYLKHYSIESDQVLLQYRGIETFNANGEVVAQLPEYYSAININASYQLTAVGAAMPDLYIKRKVDETNTFVIAGGVPGKEVSWLVISERNDPYMQHYTDQRDNVIDKPEEERGRYLMPELYGQPEEKSIDRYLINNRNSSFEHPKVVKKTIEKEEKELKPKEEIEDTEK